MDSKQIRANFEELAAEVNAAGQCRSVQMKHLRDLVGAKRLDGGPVGQIEYNLDSVGLRSTDLTTNQHDWVLVYESQSPVGQIIATARGDIEHADEHLRKAVRDLAAADIGLRTEEQEELESLRELVGQIKSLMSAL